MSEKRNRSQNYTYDDVMRLVDIVMKFKHTIENKKTDGVTCSEKNAAWEKISVLYNSQTTWHRSAEQLRQKYETLKKDTRKYSAQQRQERLRTGGGPYVEHKFHAIFTKVLEIIKLSAEGNPSRFDSDATFEAFPTNSDRPTEVLRDLAHSPEIQPDGSEVYELNLPLHTEMLYADTTPKTAVQTLKSSVHPALDVNMTGAYAIGNSSDRDIPQVTDNMNVGRSGTRKPIIRQQKVPLSASSQHLGPWAGAKKELAELQMALLRKQHEEGQIREEELFQFKKK